MAKLKLRVHPRSSAALTKLSGHQPDGCPAQEGKTVSVQTLPVLGQAAAPVEPADRPFDDPAFGQHHELAGVGPFDDLDVDLLASPLHAVPELRPLVAAIGVELQQKREQTEQRAHQQQAAVAILHVRRVDDRVQQQALRVYQDVAFLALDLLAGVIAVRIDRNPAFSALFTLWLSMMA